MKFLPRALHKRSKKEKKENIEIVSDFHWLGPIAFNSFNPIHFCEPFRTLQKFSGLVFISARAKYLFNLLPRNCSGIMIRLRTSKLMKCFLVVPALSTFCLHNDEDEKKRGKQAQRLMKRSNDHFTERSEREAEKMKVELDNPKTMTCLHYPIIYYYLCFLRSP